MIWIDNLQNQSTDAVTLQDYLENNFQEVYDFFNYSKHAVLLDSRDKINSYIRLNQQVILQLDINDKTNLSFISLLLNVSERLGLLASFQYLFEHLQKNQFNIGSRLNAASKYLIGIKGSKDYLDRYEIIYNQLQFSYETEEDNADKVLMTMINYFAEVINNFGQFNIDVVNALKARITKSKNDSPLSFLNSSIIDSILKIDLLQFDVAYNEIHLALDSFLGREDQAPVFAKDFLIEMETDYADLLQSASNDFQSIRQISVDQYKLFGNDSIFHSLQRGVKILTEEIQLHAYMNSYGNMHFSKLMSAFEFLPKDFFARKISIIDWACGQAIGSMTYLDFLKSKKIEQRIAAVTLIEPSEIALKRSSLHISKFNSLAKLETINKDLDSLVASDFKNNKAITKLHILSNILDIDLFSLKQLLDLINVNFEGDNYFLCVSPYVTDTKTSRLDSFVGYFSVKNNFKVLGKLDNTKNEWIQGWTRVIRVFNVTI